MDTIKDVLLALGKSSPIVAAVGGLLYMVVKLIISYLEKRDEKREKYFIDELASREKYFVAEIEKRDAWFAVTMKAKDEFYNATVEKKDEVLEETKSYYQGVVREKDAALQSLNDKLVSLSEKVLQTMERNTTVNEGLKTVILTLRNQNQI